MRFGDVVGSVQTTGRSLASLSVSDLLESRAAAAAESIMRQAHAEGRRLQRFVDTLILDLKFAA